MAADHEITLPADVVLRPISPVIPEAIPPGDNFSLPAEVVLRPFSQVIAIPFSEWIGSDNGGGGGGVCEDERPDTGMLYPRG